MLLNAGNLLDWWEYGGVVWAQEIVVAVRDINRRALRIHVAAEVGELGLETCVWSESAIRPDSLLRAGALGLLRQLLAMDLVDVLMTMR